jgi:hypothetical protein
MKKDRKYKKKNKGEKEEKNLFIIYLLICGILDDSVSIPDSTSIEVSCSSSVPPFKILESSLKLIQERFLQHSL